MQSNRSAYHLNPVDGEEKFLIKIRSTLFPLQNITTNFIHLMMIFNNVRAFKVCNERSFLLCMYFHVPRRYYCGLR